MNENKDVKRWQIDYSYNDGRHGTIEVITEIHKSGAFKYGNGKAGTLTINNQVEYYDLRYESGDLHRVMIDSFFRDGLVNAIESEV